MTEIPDRTSWQEMRGILRGFRMVDGEEGRTSEKANDRARETKVFMEDNGRWTAESTAPNFRARVMIWNCATKEQAKQAVDAAVDAIIAANPWPPNWQCQHVRSHGVCNAWNEFDDRSCGACGEERPKHGTECECYPCRDARRTLLRPATADSDPENVC